MKLHELLDQRLEEFKDRKGHHVYVFLNSKTGESRTTVLTQGQYESGEYIPMKPEEEYMGEQIK